ncbi:MAG TPA: bifunctional diaminohydroxyphosphoribosylaminopyrimidine deaminase/5-amino-6-(5-phosphoribosylamino)uracil reductase RibD [Hyphomicrobium sp.]|nr:bifunctional diaminohydroxyphosphoribosylaminopyrimidine deaminase/5-amino-6-(5-phosphoribosylamino)uracil reductase RibD [Hyphomicrobium sp.]
MDRAANARFDAHMMAIALRLAARGLGRTAPNPSVGAVIADEATGEIISRAWTAPGGRPHAEPLAIAKAGTRARGATLYVTLEPCSHHGATPPCADAIVAAGMGRVVCAIEDPDPRVAGRGLSRLREAGIAVERGVGAEEAHWVTAGHVLRVTERRPYVTAKLALDADGGVPRGGEGQPTWVTGEGARAQGHLLRARSDAILVGRRTVIDDDPLLTCRLPGLEDRSPVRVVLARNPAGLATSRLAQTAREHPLWVFCAESTDAAALASAGARIFSMPLVDGQLWLPAVMEALAASGITRLLVEGGPATWRSFSHGGLIDEVALFRARGKERAVLADETALQALDRYISTGGLTIYDRRTIGGDDVLALRRPWLRGGARTA